MMGLVEWYLYRELDVDAAVWGITTAKTKARRRLEFMRNSKMASMARAEWERERIMGDEVRG